MENFYEFLVWLIWSTKVLSIINTSSLVLQFMQHMLKKKKIPLCNCNLLIKLKCLTLQS